MLRNGVSMIVKFVFSILFLLFFLQSAFFGQTNKSEVIPGVELTSSVVKLPKDALKIEIKLLNRSDRPIYIATNPVQIDRTPGYYISVDQTEPTTIFVSSRVFARLRYSPYTVDTSVKLKKLLPTEEVSCSITLESSLLETVPPIDLPLDKKKIDLGKVKLIKLQVAYFPEEKGLVDFLKSKPFGWFIDGSEKLATGKLAGKRLYEVQQLATNNIKLETKTDYR